MVCRAAFLALCVLPTLGVFAWSSSRISAGRSTESAAELSRELGLKVSLAGVAYPRPAVALYDGVELADPETSAPLARMRFLEIAESSSATAIVASQPVLDAVRLGRLWQAAAERMRDDNSAMPPVRLVAREATLEWPGPSPAGGDSQTLTDVLGELAVKSDGQRQTTASLSFRLAGSESPEPVRVRYTRQASAPQPAAIVERNSFHSGLDGAVTVSTRFELDTGGASVPLSMLTVPLGLADRLGPRAKFRGSLWASETRDGWDGELTGEFTDVDLQTAIEEQFPHHMSGTATLTIARARFHGGRLEEARGSLVAVSGVIGQSLLSAAARHLQLSGTAGANSNEALVPYDRLAFSFEIDSSGLTIHGQCDRPPGTIVRRGDTALLTEAGGGPVPVIALLRTLVPLSEVQVPATRESDWLMQCLPVPQIVPPKGELPHGKLRLMREP
jgi:hypothetical protein